MWATLHDNLSFGSPPPPLAPLPPLRSTLSSLSYQISFSPSPSTIFHFIKLSYHKLNESSARFLPLFSSQPAPFTIFPLQLTPPHPHPQFSTSPSDSSCRPLWILPHTESSGGCSYSSEEALSVDGSRGWERLFSPLGSKSRLCSAPGLCRVKFPSTDTWGRQAMK